MSGRTWRDIILAIFALQWGGSGLWAAALPQSFYDSYPGAGRTWISIDGPYNEHLIRDVGSLFLGLGVISAFALWQRSPAVVRVVGLAVAVFSVPHLLYHAFNTEPWETADAVVSLSGLLGMLVLAVLLIWNPGPAETVD